MYDTDAFDTVAFDSYVPPAAPAAAPSERIFLLDGHVSDQATLATLNTAAMPVANLLDQQPTKVWRSTSNVDSIFFTFATLTAATALALNAVKFSSAGMWRMRFFPTDADRAAETNVLIDTNWESVWPGGTKPQDDSLGNLLVLMRWPNTASLMYGRLDLADTGAAYLEAGRLICGTAVQLSINPDFDGASIDYDIGDVVTKSEWGSYYGDQRGQGRGFKLKWTAAEWCEVRDDILPMLRRRGLTRDLICSIDPAATGGDFYMESMQGRFASAPSVAPQPLWSGTTGKMMWGFSLDLDECI